MAEPRPDALVIRAELAELARVADWAERLSAGLALSGTVAYAVQLCLEEAISNIIRHGFPGQAELEEQTIGLTLERQGRSAILTIRDRGAPFDPRTAPPGRPQTPDDATVGGQGIHLMRQFSQAMDYVRDGERNCLILRFDLAEAP
jgi:serine/threonine-protein kinase RsbW